MPRLRRRRIVAALGLVVVLPLGIVVLYANCVPLGDPSDRTIASGNVVLSADGHVLQRDTKAGIRIPVVLERIAPIAVEATIAAEDQRFWGHFGVDPLALARSISEDPLHPSGASTLSQQIGRRLYLKNPSGPWAWRKGREILTALQLDAQFSKQDILTLYLNETYYGRGAYGIEAASQVYFGVAASNLDLAQASLLAALPQQPSVFDPDVRDGPARARQRYVLDRLVADGKVSATRADDAFAETLRFQDELSGPLASHFVRYALDELFLLRPDLEDVSGLVIETTLDASLSGEAERIVRLRVDELAERNANNAAVVVLDPRDGAILAMVGNTDFNDAEHSGQVNMAVEARQPGSALKPFLYAAAFERGYTAATTVLDVPTVFQTASGPYAPLNYDRRFHGVVSTRTALASSLNVPAVRVLEEMGVDAFLEIAHRVGLGTLTNSEIYGLALTLGGGEVRLIDLTAAYGALAADGRLSRPYAVQRVRDRTGAIVYERAPEAATTVLDPAHAYILADVLSDREARIIGFGERSPLDTPMRTAVKTGTTTGFRDNWTIGFTPSRVVGVWVGNADNSPMRNTSGVDGAGPIWRDVIIEAVRGEPDEWLPRPDTVVQVEVCPPTGLLPGPACPLRGPEMFVEGEVPSKTETYYVRGPAGELLYNPPPEARAWALAAGLPLAPTPKNVMGELFVLRPTSGSVHYLAPELRRQEMILQASVPEGTTLVSFFVDGVLAGTGTPDEPSVTWELEAGSHTLEVVADLPTGPIRASVSFVVREDS